MSATNRRTPRILELLAPARNADIAIAAIDHGADAVYIGASHHGARHAAGNSIDDIKRVVEYAHRFRARVYVTVNTIIYDNELEGVKKLITDLYHAGVDAIIVQDMAILEMDLPPIALHASTQCDIHTPERARFLQDAGFSQLVLARELTLDEIRAIRRATTVPLEAFVHGALCVSYSGNCQASLLATGRSANRGECAQMCRLSYDLIDGDGNRVSTDKHLLSLRDMNRLNQLDSMIDAGIDSFKIEGRLKDIDYVKTVVSAYSDRLNDIIASHPQGTLKRRALGRSIRTFTPDLNDTFNRGFTDYFLASPSPAAHMATFDTPKSAGVKIGTVVSVKDRFIIVKTSAELANGDGLTFYDSKGKLAGFRANKVESNKIFPTEMPRDLKPGTTLYRNLNIKRDVAMNRNTARRIIDVDMTLRSTHYVDLGQVDPPVRASSSTFIESAPQVKGASSSTVLALDISLPGTSITATATIEIPVAQARTPQAVARQNTLSKLGDTPYTLSTLIDLVDKSLFIPLSLLATLRRDATQALDTALKASYPMEYRRPSDGTVPSLGREDTTYADNIANHLAADFYRQAGATDIVPALEVQAPAGKTRVMVTRYCLRRELGRCLKTPEGKKLKGPLTLRSNYGDMPLEFDCKNCHMHVFATKKA